MNRDQLKKNVGQRIQLVPVAIELDEYGRELPGIDDVWILESVMDDGPYVTNPRTGHFTTLGYDHVHHFTSNPIASKSGIPPGFLTLNIQVFLQGRNLWVRPTRPGERLAPPPPPIDEVLVDSGYINEIGLVAALQADGFEVVWGDLKRLESLRLDGWDFVIEPYTMGRFRTFRRSDSILLKRLAHQRSA